MLEKKAIGIVHFPNKNQFLSSLFLVSKKDGGNRPVINLKSLNQHIPYLNIQMDNITALAYLKKMGGTHSKLLTDLSKEIWKYLLEHQITITVEYLPGSLNVLADRQSRSVKDSSEWKLKAQIFRELAKQGGHRAQIFLLQD